MKVCPKCGYVDDENWRVVRWRPHVDYMRPDLFKEGYPKILLQFESGSKYVSEGHYCYHITPKGFVERVWIEHWKAYGKKAFHQPYESVNHYHDPFQKKLVVGEGEKQQ
jgi:hypothetical protein